MNESFPYFPHSTRHALVTFGQKFEIGGKAHFGHTLQNLTKYLAFKFFQKNSFL